MFKKYKLATGDVMGLPVVVERGERMALIDEAKKRANDPDWRSPWFTSASDLEEWAVAQGIEAFAFEGQRAELI